MSTVIRFLPDLGRWVTQGLDEGQPPDRLITKMVAEKMQLEVATAIIGAFVDARRAGRPSPVDSVVVAEEITAPVAAGSRLAAGPRLPAADRTARVLARADNPTLALLDGLLTPEECAELVALARPRLQPSTVVDPDSGQDVVATYRTSLGMFFRPSENALIERLDRRFAAVMNLPLENGEGLQVLWYRARRGQQPPPRLPRPDERRESGVDRPQRPARQHRRHLLERPGSRRRDVLPARRLVGDPAARNQPLLRKLRPPGTYR